MKKQRQLDIFSILINDGFITADVIAQKLSISNKTVRNYLQNSENLLSPFALQLFSKIGSGYYLEGTAENKLKFRYYLEEQKKETAKLPPQKEFATSFTDCYAVIRLYMSLN